MTRPSYHRIILSITFALSYCTPPMAANASSYQAYCKGTAPYRYYPVTPATDLYYNYQPYVGNEKAIFSNKYRAMDFFEGRSRFTLLAPALPRNEKGRTYDRFKLYFVNSQVAMMAKLVGGLEDSLGRFPLLLVTSANPPPELHATVKNSVNFFTNKLKKLLVDWNTNADVADSQKSGTTLTSALSAATCASAQLDDTFSDVLAAKSSIAHATIGATNDNYVKFPLEGDILNALLATTPTDPICSSQSMYLGDRLATSYFLSIQAFTRT